MTTRLTEPDIRAMAGEASDRRDLWVAFLGAASVRTMAEVGVYRGKFAAHLLHRCPSLERYYMIDPWQHLEGWNKPANRPDAQFETFYRESLDRTEAYAGKRVVLRGRTLDVADRIADGELDLAYVDGDHTLRGITTDLLTVFPKVRQGGWVAGDDLCRSIFQHADGFEPTLVFPYVLYFAEAVGARLYALPFRQFLLEKGPADGFAFLDLTGKYTRTTLQAQLDRRPPAADGRRDSGMRASRSVARRVLARVRRGSS